MILFLFILIEFINLILIISIYLNIIFLIFKIKKNSVNK